MKLMQFKNPGDISKNRTIFLIKKTTQIPGFIIFRKKATKIPFFLVTAEEKK